MSGYMQFLLTNEVSIIELQSDTIRDYIEIYNNLNLGGERVYWIYIRLYNSQEVDMITYSSEFDQIFNHISIEKIDREFDQIHSDIMYLIDEKCSFEFRQEPTIVFTITKKIPLALVKSIDLTTFLREYNEIGSFLRVKIDTSQIHLTWFSEQRQEGVVDDSSLFFDTHSQEFEDILRLSRYCSIQILENREN